MNQQNRVHQKEVYAPWEKKNSVMLFQQMMLLWMLYITENPLL